MNAQEVIELEQSYVLGVYGRAPFVLERGEGSTLYDAEGRAYLDCVAGIAVNALGYNDAGVMQAMSAAAATGCYTSATSTTRRRTPGWLRCCAKPALPTRFTSATAAPRRTKARSSLLAAMVAPTAVRRRSRFWPSPTPFTDARWAALAATPRPKYQDPFKPLMPGVRFAEFNDLASARAQMDDRVCAIIVEPIQGEGGIYAATPEFLAGLRALADEFDALLIYDEVQCGVGRTGSLWAHQGYDNGGEAYAPDILTAAKPLAAGLPIGAILMRQRVAETLHKGDHGSTFAGGPLVTSVAHHVVSRVAQPAFLAEVEAKGKLLHDLLVEISSPHIVEIRGKGLMVGVELDIEAAEVVSRGYAEGLILVNAGPNVLRLVPPLVITEAEIHEVVARLTRVLHTL
jgi:acetylornithine/N-succinyldiaminopimelate aminotransferase